MAATETSIVNRILRNCDKLEDAVALKLHGSAYSRSGVPDILILYKGKAYFFEVKRPGKFPTRIQLHMIDRLRAAGIYAGVAYSWEDVSHVIGVIQ